MSDSDHTRKTESSENIGDSGYSSEGSGTKVLVIQEPDASFSFATTKDYEDPYADPPPTEREVLAENAIQFEAFVRKHMMFYAFIATYLVCSETVTAIMFYYYTDDYLLSVSINEKIPRNDSSMASLKASCRVFFVIYCVVLSMTYILSLIGIYLRSANIFDHLMSLAFFCSFIELFLAPVGHFNILTFVPRFLSVMYLKFLHMLLLRHSLSRGIPVL